VPAMLPKMISASTLKNFSPPKDLLRIRLKDSQAHEFFFNPILSHAREKVDMAKIRRVKIQKNVCKEGIFLIIKDDIEAWAPCILSSVFMTTKGQEGRNEW
jgi:hypothetical protein